MARVPVNEYGRRIGESHHRARVSDDAVTQLHALRAAGTSYGRLAAMLGLAKSTVRDICTGRIRAACSAHAFKNVADASLPVNLIEALAIEVPEGEEPDDSTPEPLLSVQDLGLPPLNPEEPGQRAMRLVCWAILKVPTP